MAKFSFYCDACATEHSSWRECHFLRCSSCGGEIDSTGHCPNYCEEEIAMPESASLTFPEDK